MIPSLGKKIVYSSLDRYTDPQSIGGIGVSPVQAQAKACGYQKLFFDCNSVLEVNIPKMIATRVA
jgi:hypothetical protein